MNISSGGPHILLFERDQQLTTLLMSEFQLAGYEFHAARTAVEVFDAIARFPIRLVLVNLAQAAASRREFWVALDTQRRGKGVQVFTFHCTNLAGYGPSSSLDDAEDRSHTALADMEVDGMTGMMNLVSAVRARIPGTTTSGSLSRASSMAPTAQPARNSNPGFITPLITQPTGPMPAVNPNGSATAASARSYTGSTPALQKQIPLPNPPTPLPMPASMNTPPGYVPASQPQGNVPTSYTDKIRAVIYPGQRSWPDARNIAGAEQRTPPAEQINRNFPPVPQPQIEAEFRPTRDAREMNRPPVNPMQQEPAASTSSGSRRPAQDPSESSLDQLSRMVQNQRQPNWEMRREREDYRDARKDEIGQQTLRPLPQMDAPSMGEFSLRASPIQDLPMERANYNTNPVQRESMEPRRMHPEEMRREQDIPMERVTYSSGAVQREPEVRRMHPEEIRREQDMPMERVAYSTGPVQREPEVRRVQAEEVRLDGERYMATPPPIAPQMQPPVAQRPPVREEPVEQRNTSGPLFDASSRENQILLEQVQATLLGALPPRSEAEKRVATDNALLLNIVQSLPVMPPLPPQEQPPVLNGRATRSLGSVLLEGHLVPQNRLEVAQHIQRMLKGVDMNYQLGEILLMFKLLTHDQLLAASLVSYGMITPVQISALGRIRQELHSMGLEYDLESLLMLFRIMTPEQLRELRANWSS